jgi:Putative Flp pilus-assembly TadE/G-like
MRSRRDNGQNGSVLVMVAVWLPVLALFASFAIDISHWWDYSRNLQNRADAAALAAGDGFGGACFGNYTTTQTDVIGQVAQQYSGPPNEDPGNPYAVPDNLPYPYSTFPPSEYKNVPNLTKGTPPNYHVLLNSTTSWDKGGADWNMGSGDAKGSSLALCSSTDEDGNTGAMADVRVTQANLGLFIPLVGIKPTISAHARVTLEAVGGENDVTPIAVRDPGATKCVEAQFFNAATNNQIGADVPLARKGIDPNTGAIQWDNSGAPASVAIPTGANVYVEIVTDYCGGNPSTYDSGSGLLYINSYPVTAPSSGITTGGVTLSGTCNSDSLSNQYFTNQSCTVGLTAHVAGATEVYATDTNTNTTIQLGNGGSGNTWSTPADNGFTIAPGSGQHLFDITTTKNCKSGKACDLGVQAQAFGACNDTNLTCNNPPDDSGPIVLAQLRLASDPAGSWASDPTQTYGENAFAGDPTNPQSMVVTVEIAGLRNAQPGDPPTVLRFSENAKNANHATGLIDCGQGQSATGGLAAIINNCPTVNTSACANNEFLSCAPLARNERPVSDPSCNPEGNDLSGTVVARTAADPLQPVDCTGTAAGNMPPVIGGISCRVLVDGCDDKGKLLGGTECSSNNWSPTDGASSIPTGDPRALTMVITTPYDLTKNNSGQIIPIQDFATFYITGWTTQGNNPSCGSYAAPPDGVASDAELHNNCPDGTVPPNGNCSGVSKGMVWGYWMKYTDVGGIPSGEACKLDTFGNCVPALTR